MYEECEAQEEVRSLSKSGEMYDYKTVQLCVEQRKNGGTGGNGGTRLVKERAVPAVAAAAVPAKKD